VPAIANYNACQSVAGKRDIIKVYRGSACLVDPSKSGICSVEDSACPADGKATGWLWKVNGFNGLIVE